MRSPAWKSIVLFAVAIALFGLSWCLPAEGAVLKYDPNQLAGARADGPYVVGSLVRVGGEDRVVTHLGAQDADAADDAQDPDGVDGLTGYADDDGFLNDPINVGLWTADGSTLLANVAVTSADPYIGSWRYAPIAGGPVTLQANTDYLVGAAVGGGIEWFLDGSSQGNTPVAADDGFALLENRFAVGGALVPPTNNGGGAVGRWGTANMLEIPEPPPSALFTYDLTQQAAARADGPYTIGTLFRVGENDRVISHLGAQDADAAVDSQDADGPDALTGFADDDGFFNEPIQVGLWTADGNTLLASVSVTSADMELGSWRYAPIPGGPIRLEANTDYLIGTLVGGGIEWFLDGTEGGFSNFPFAAGDDIVLVPLAGGLLQVLGLLDVGQFAGLWVLEALGPLGRSGELVGVEAPAVARPAGVEQRPMAPHFRHVHLASLFLRRCARRDQSSIHVQLSKQSNVPPHLHLVTLSRRLVRWQVSQITTLTLMSNGSIFVWSKSCKT